MRLDGYPCPGGKIRGLARVCARRVSWPLSELCFSPLPRCRRSARTCRGRALRLRVAGSGGDVRRIAACSPTPRAPRQRLQRVPNLPRGGLSRRFGAGMLAALDQAYGLRPDEHPWVEPAEHFHARLELMSRVDVAAAMVFGARPLLLQLCGWLAARRSGVRAYTLSWCHDTMRSKTPATAAPSRSAPPRRHATSSTSVGYWRSTWDM